MTLSVVFRRIGWTPVVLVVGLFFFLALASASQFLMVSTSFGQRAQWGIAFRIGLKDAAPWLILSAPVLFLASRFPIRQQQWQRHVIIHLVGAIAVALVYPLIAPHFGDQVTPIHTITPLPPSPGPVQVQIPYKERFFVSVTTQMVMNFLTYAVLVGVWSALEHARRLSLREQQAEELTRRLAEARLDLLKAQLQPHFLFNTLNAIAGMVYTNPKAADEMIGSLSDLLRVVLDEKVGQLISLKQELSYLEHYIQIQRVRFGDRLSVEEKIDPKALDVPVPALILQPLVENAIKHGIEPRRSGGRVWIEAIVKESRLVLQIRDNGLGLNPSVDQRKGVGLSNTKARLKQLFGEDQLFQLGKSAEGGVIVTLEMPIPKAAMVVGAPSKSTVSGKEALEPI